MCPSRKYVLLDILDLFQNDVDLGLSLFLLVPKFARLRCYGWTPAPAVTGLPRPEQSKALTVPAYEGVWFEDLQCLQAT